MIAIVDYGVGNLYSLTSSLQTVGADVVVTGDGETLRKADKILLPGVGAFSDAIKKLKETGLAKILVEEAQKGKKLLGICLGMQLLFEKSYEYGEHDGLALLKGKVVPMRGVIDETLKIPQIGWNSLRFEKSHPLLKYIKDGDFVYFVHSYYAKDCEDSLLLTTEYGAHLTAAVVKNNVAGMQFHPEKSGEVGLKLLRAFVEWE